MENTPEYIAWKHIKQRCLNPNCDAYKNYGARGITICDRWKNSFKAFYQEVGARPSERHSIDRIDNNRGYEPGNIRWTDRATQNINQRLRKSNTSGYKGIHWNKQHKKWHSRIKVGKEDIHIGYFSAPEEAVIARDQYILDNELSQYPLQSNYFRALYPE